MKKTHRSRHIENYPDINQVIYIDIETTGLINHPTLGMPAIIQFSARTLKD